MKDLENELLTLLSTKWSLTTGVMAATNIEFHRGIKEPEKIVKPQVRVQHQRLDQAPQGASAEFLEGTGSELVIIQVKAKKGTISEIETAKENKWIGMKEVDRILREETLPTGWIEAYVVDSVCMDSLIESPPIMEEQLRVLIKYQV